MNKTDLVNLSNRIKIYTAVKCAASQLARQKLFAYLAKYFRIFEQHAWGLFLKNWIHIHKKQACLAHMCGIKKALQLQSKQ